MKATIANRIVKSLYKAVEKSGLTAHKLRDLSWEHVRALEEVIADVLNKVNAEQGTDLQYQITTAGYRKNDGAEWKEYNFQLYSDTEDCGVIGGHINCHQAGTVQDPWSAYDMTASFWRL